MPGNAVLHRRALVIQERNSGPDHPYVAQALSDLAQLLVLTSSRFSEAEQLLRRALTIQETSLGPNHAYVANTLTGLAQLLQATNRFSEAEPLYRRALAIRESTFGPDHMPVAVSLNAVARILAETNRLSDAEPLIRRALAIQEREQPRPLGYRRYPQQPRLPVGEYRPPQRGRTAVSACIGNGREGSWGRPLDDRDSSSTIWQCCCRKPIDSTRPSRFTDAR